MARYGSGRLGMACSYARFGKFTSEEGSLTRGWNLAFRRCKQISQPLAHALVVAVSRMLWLEAAGGLLPGVWAGV